MGTNLDKRLKAMEQSTACADCPHQRIKNMSMEEVDARIMELLRKGGYSERLIEELST